MVSEEPEICFYPLIVPLRLSVGPRVVCGGDVLLDPQSAAQFLDELGGKPWIPVAYNFVGQPIVSDYDLKERARGFFGHNGLVAGHEVCHFCAALVHDGEYGVIPIR